MKKILTICAIIFATALAFTSCAKECYECQYPGQDQDGDGFPDNNGENGNNSGDYTTSYYYITEYSSFEKIDVDVDGYCDGFGLETWTIVTVFDENDDPYTVVYTKSLDENQFNFDKVYWASIRSLDNYYSCNWSANFNLPAEELIGW
jgi:hypothetical protein